MINNYISFSIMDIVENVEFNEAEEDEAVLGAILAAIDDDNELEDGERRGEVIPVDIEGYRTMSNTSFKEHFRMDRITFQKLVVAVGQHMRITNRLIRLRTPLDLCLLMGLWPLFNPDTFRSSGISFGKKRASIHYHYSYLIEILREMAPKYIKWPNALERDFIKTVFEEKYGYPGVVGCIDGVNISITAPLEQPRRYINRHDTYSMLVQAVCDHRLLYRDLYVGQPGCIGDARNFERSPLSRNLLTCPEMMSEGEHIVGDGAYTCTSKLLIPYVDDHQLTRRQRVHNRLLSACRSKVENSFCLWRAKERRLKHLPMRNVHLVNDHIVASAVVHNFIILDGNECEGLCPVVPQNITDDDYQRLTDEARATGTIKREFIAHLLCPGDDP